MDSLCPGCLGQAVVTLRLPCAIVKSPRRHKRVPFVNIAFLCSWSIKRRQWKHKLDYCGVVYAHLATGCGIKAKDPSELDSDRWIPHSMCCENPALRDSRATSQRDSPIWIQPLGVFHYITPGFNGLGKDNCKTRRETFMFGDWVRLMLENWQYYFLMFVTSRNDFIVMMLRAPLAVFGITPVLSSQTGCCDWRTSNSLTKLVRSDK